MTPRDGTPAAEDEQMSVCCGAPEHPDVPGFCSACNEGTGFETAKQIEEDALTRLLKLNAEY